MKKKEIISAILQKEFTMNTKLINKLKVGLKACTSFNNGKCYNCPYYNEPDCLGLLLRDVNEYVKVFEAVAEILKEETRTHYENLCRKIFK